MIIYIRKVKTLQKMFFSPKKRVIIMKKLLLTCAMASSVLLAACASGVGISQSKNVEQEAYTVKTDRFVCEPGVVTARYTDPNTVEIVIEDQSVVMKRVQAASGSLYQSETGLFGQGGSWHVKNDVAEFEVINTKGMPIKFLCQKQ